MELYTKIISSFVFPVHEYLKHHDSVRRREALETSQWFDGPKIDAQRMEGLRAFLVKAARDVPYYAGLFKSNNLDPDRISSLRDLQRIPFLTKRLIRDNTETLKSTTAGRLVRYNTGGSSGEPLIFYMGMDRVSQDVAAKWRATRWWDVDIGDREIVIWGSPIELGAQDRVRIWRDRVIRSKLLSAFEMSESKLDSFIDTIRRFRPKMLFGYPSALAHIAKHAIKRQVSLSDCGIKVAFVTSEKLYDEQRTLIERVMGCPVANGYGGRDAGFLAHQCPSGGMHITAEEIILEIVDAQGQPVEEGQPGEIVVTNMATGDFPFVRYLTGDVGVLDSRPCPCGRGLPMLKEIQGRSTDFLVKTDGTTVHGLALIYVLRDMPEVDAFKIIQEAKAFIRILVVPMQGFQVDIAQVRASIRKRMGESMEVEVCVVDKIAPEKSGKHRYVVNAIPAS